MAYTATLTRVARYTADITRALFDMPNYIINRYDLTGLTGGLTTDLDGLADSTLTRLENGARMIVSLTHSDGETIRCEYQLGAIGASVEAAPWIIVCDNDTDRCWRLDRGSVFKGGLPCVYNATSAKFHRVWAVGADGSAVPSVDETGFTIPA